MDRCSRTSPAMIVMKALTSIPADIELAVWQIVAQLRSGRTTGQTAASESYEDYSRSFATPDADILRVGSVSQIVRRYRRFEVG
jgi:hypothetical protein